MSVSSELSVPSIFNNSSAFGFVEENASASNASASETMRRLFRRRSSLSDHLNFFLIKAAFHGYQQIEEKGRLGLPIEILQRLDTYDIAALYIGIQMLKGRFVRKGKEGLIGAPLGTLISSLVSAAYAYSERRNPTENAARAMKRMGVGFSEHKNSSSIAERVESLDEKVKLQFFRSFFTKRRHSQEDDYKADFHDYVFAQYHSSEGGIPERIPIDSNASRDAYSNGLILLMREKEAWGNDFSFEGFNGKIVPSETREDRIYLVQANENAPLSSLKTFEYACSCPHGYRKMYNHRVSGEECKHIKRLRKEQLDEQRTKALRDGKGQLSLLH